MFSRLTSYFQEAQLEFKRVNWPTRQETIRLTGMVIGLSLIFAVFLGVLDMVFNYILVHYFI
ncbi:preprotein translocase subunit SecE [Candidatus Wolfebacteria bacterium RIFOXYD12_FULL_48_21]|uniref:Protein translocase subunit SecE n=1 Tax=Candidatus Wolfebacteria bacterium RIFOXYD1_FULL_48_65 TaxID=1802561 RepID=A0A1F8E232_9BACT|nr:MAG: preprotein translocase subunit SecE [Candidatus Wolfebacteria bacterium RIFOXYD1_FULL_48_65]OGM94421.1 MAG: preprotein translocase subunit SecE [Candidatus Wolfebacteria bacterium RIFOXYD12_FULL_48_21]OGM97377.1 MAG: preprotein translocase subunit SecE [Candidatus Wolfebacteria bacterium RIFOXYD2_FULL_48_11]